MIHLLRRLGVGGLSITAVWLVSFVVLLAVTPHGKTATGEGGVSGDGIYYFVQLESLVRDGDLDFANNLEAFRQNPHVAKQLDEYASGETTPAGRTPNLFSVGPALLWSPVCLVLLPFGRTAALLAPSISTLLFVLVGLLATHRACRLLGLGDRMSAFSVCSIYLGTNLLYYSTFEASMAHGVGFGLVSVVLWLALRLRVRLRTAANAEQKLGWYAALGLLAGLATIVRWQLLLVVAPLCVYAVWPGGQSLRRNIRRWAVMITAFIVAIVPQLVVWHGVYGSWLLIPQGEGFFRWSSPHFAEVLLSARHGLLSWTPLVTLALLGLIVGGQKMAKKNRVLASLALALIVGQIYVNGSLIEWWGGDAFGARRFTDIACLFALGLALLLAHVKSKMPRRALLVLIVILVGANLLFIQIYRHGLIPRAEPVTFSQLRHAVETSWR